MTDRLEDGKEPIMDSKESIATDVGTVPPASSVASILAGMFLEKNVRKGRKIEIPSLGIIIGKANLYNGSKGPEDVNEKELSPKNT